MMKRVAGALPRALNFKMPAEWERHSQCWILWPVRHDNWRLQAGPAREAFSEVIKAISQFEHVGVGVPKSHVSEAREILTGKQITNFTIHEIESDDCWVRDSGPTFVVSEDDKELGAVNWDFNAWGKIYEPFENDRQVGGKIMEICNVMTQFRADFVLEGGSIHVDGEGTLLTTEECLLNSNRNPHLTKSQIEEHLIQYLNVSKVIWLPLGLYGDEDTNGHIDNFCCFFKPGGVLLAWTDDESDPQYQISRDAFAVLSQVTDAKGRQLEIVKIPIPEPMFYTESDLESYGHVDTNRTAGQRLAGSYVNFYIANNGIVVPSFGCPQDSEAVSILQQCFPNRRIVSIPGKEILFGGGNVHCITQQQPAV